MTYGVSAADIGQTAKVAAVTANQPDAPVWRGEKIKKKIKKAGSPKINSVKLDLQFNLKLICVKIPHFEVVMILMLEMV